MVAEAMAAVFRAATDSARSLDFELRADSILEIVLVRQTLAKEGSCRSAYFMEFIAVAWGLEESCAGTMIGLE
jgi:hypothetical protein